MPKTLIGTVSSNAPDKTIVITVVDRKTHPLYKKQYTASSKFMAHDENNECKVGDKVVIVETRPLSTRKRYKLQEILQRSELTDKDREIIDADETAQEKSETDEAEDKDLKNE